MPNETAIANSGLDLHVKTEAGWHWLAVDQPTAQTNEVTLVENLLPGKREYLLYLLEINSRARLLRHGARQGTSSWLAVDAINGSDGTK